MLCPKCRRYQLYEERDHWGKYLVCLSDGFVVEEPLRGPAIGLPSPQEQSAETVRRRRQKNPSRQGVRL